MLTRNGFASQRIDGYIDKRLTHTDVARVFSVDDANVGLGLETSGQALRFDIVIFQGERSDLVMTTVTT